MFEVSVECNDDDNDDNDDSFLSSCLPGSKIDQKQARKSNLVPGHCAET